MRYILLSKGNNILHNLHSIKSNKLSIKSEFDSPHILNILSYVTKVSSTYFPYVKLKLDIKGEGYLLPTLEPRAKISPLTKKGIRAMRR